MQCPKHFLFACSNAKASVSVLRNDLTLRNGKQCNMQLLSCPSEGGYVELFFEAVDYAD